GLTVLEAMSSGCAVIASTAGAWPDIITHGENGLLVPIADVEATRASLIHLVDHEEARIAMGSEARSQVLAQYRVEDEARALCQWYQALIQEAK
ncbi:MAG: glycosyltransferase, partial [Gammaproteobacteria bacterium]|nr:glycosyltransferase [Gammaproteobacteria bacterium]